jgi:hypothetical protein
MARERKGGKSRKNLYQDKINMPDPLVALRAIRREERKQEEEGEEEEEEEEERATCFQDRWRRFKEKLATDPDSLRLPLVEKMESLGSVKPGSDRLDGYMPKRVCGHAGAGRMHPDSLICTRSRERFEILQYLIRRDGVREKGDLLNHPMLSLACSQATKAVNFECMGHGLWDPFHFSLEERRRAVMQSVQGGCWITGFTRPLYSVETTDIYAVEDRVRPESLLFEIKILGLLCATCGSPLHLRKCSSCRGVTYCSRACQVKDWEEGGHKKQCRMIKILMDNQNTYLSIN